MKSLNKSVTKILNFNKVRGWDPAAGYLAKSIMIEAAELLEHFQWDESSKSRKGVKEKDWDEVALEAVDVFWYLVSFCNKAGIDLNVALEKKLKILEVKYPEKMFNGKHNDKFYKSQKLKYRKNRNK